MYLEWLAEVGRAAQGTPLLCWWISRPSGTLRLPKMWSNRSKQDRTSTHLHHPQLHRNLTDPPQRQNRRNSGGLLCLGDSVSLREPPRGGDFDKLGPGSGKLLQDRFYPVQSVLPAEGPALKSKGDGQESWGRRGFDTQFDSAALWVPLHFEPSHLQPRSPSLNQPPWSLILSS